MSERQKRGAQTVSDLSKRLAGFARERDWDQFHSPKNLVAAIQIEAAELAELFLWSSNKESYVVLSERAQEIKDELADVLIYLVLLSNKMKCNPVTEAFRKIEENEKRYPVEQAKGNAKKYNILSGARRVRK